MRLPWGPRALRTCRTRRPGASMYGQGDVAKWTKAEVCKTSIRRFESARRLHTLSPPGGGPAFGRGADETPLVARPEVLARQLGTGRSRVHNAVPAVDGRAAGDGGPGQQERLRQADVVARTCRGVPLFARCGLDGGHADERRRPQSGPPWNRGAVRSGLSGVECSQVAPTGGR